MQPPVPFNSDTVKWCHETAKDGKDVSFYNVPADWAEAFVRDETARSGDFYVRANINDTQSKCPANIKSRVDYHCHHGPEDRTAPAAREAAAAAASASQRASVVAKGESIKVGCKCHFSITIYRATPKEAVIRYHERQHTGHDGRQRAYLSQQTIDFLRTELTLNKDISTKDLQRRNRDRYLVPARIGRPHTDAAVVQQEFEASNPPRDYWVTNADISNIREQLKREMSMHSDNDAQAVRLLVAQHKDNIFIYQARC